MGGVKGGELGGGGGEGRIWFGRERRKDLITLQCHFICDLQTCCKIKVMYRLGKDVESLLFPVYHNN